jgi:hypothetical protein
MEQQTARTIYGTLNGTEITEEPSKKVIIAFPYRPIREEANGKTGFFNLKYAENLESWIIFSFFEMGIDDLNELLKSQEPKDENVVQ